MLPTDNPERTMHFFRSSLFFLFFFLFLSLSALLPSTYCDISIDSDEIEISLSSSDSIPPLVRSEAVMTQFLKEKLTPFFEDYATKNWSRERFRKEHLQQVGAVLLDSGVQYKPVKQTTSREEKASPTIDSFIEIRRRGMTLDGAIFLDEFQRKQNPVVKMSQVKQGLNQVIALMKEGEIFQVYVPSELVHENKDLKSVVSSDRDVIFFVELQKVNPELSFLHKLKQFLTQDSFFKPVKNYHIVFFVLYLGGKRLISFLFNLTKQKKKRNGSIKKALARHILFDKKSEEKCKEVKSILEKDVSLFGKYAKEYSLCPSKAKEGSLGWFYEEQMVKEFDQVVFDPLTEEKTVVGPIKTEFGFHLIIIDKRKNIVPSKEK